MRLQLLVPAVVFVVLLVVFRQFVVSLYLILSVLFNYLVTLGLTYIVFRFADPAGFTGIDWKVPIFLFTILIAVGEDYNIFLMTRIDEEKRRTARSAASRRHWTGPAASFPRAASSWPAPSRPVRRVAGRDEATRFRAGRRRPSGHVDRPAHPGSNLFPTFSNANARVFGTVRSGPRGSRNTAIVERCRPVAFWHLER